MRLFFEALGLKVVVLAEEIPPTTRAMIDSIDPDLLQWRLDRQQNGFYDQLRIAKQARKQQAAAEQAA
jgi:hypothetical protein